MIGEINGQAINTELPLNGLSPRIKLVVVGFTDSLFAARGLEFLSSFPVVGFTSSTFSPVYFWDAGREGQVANFCSPVSQAEFASPETGLSFASAPETEIFECISQSAFVDFTSEPTQGLWQFRSEPSCEIVEGLLEDTVTEFVSIPSYNTRGEC